MISIATMTKVICALVQTEKPIILLGEPGTGKTAFINALMNAAKRVLRELIGSRLDPTDVAGIPGRVVDPETGIAETIPSRPWFIRQAQEDAAKGIATCIFWDEFSNTSRATQGSILTGLWGGRFGIYELPAGTWQMLAANPPDCAADGIDFAAPTSNRLYHIQWKPSVADWAKGAREGWPTPTFYWVDKDKAAVARKVWVNLITSFCEARPAQAQKLPDTEVGRSGAWPSMRTWEEYGADALAHLDALACEFAAGEKRECQLTMLAAAVGDAAALEFFGWYDNLDLPKPEDLIKNPKSFKPSGRNDVNFVALTSVAQYVAEAPTADNFTRGWEVMFVAANAGLVDVASTAARELARLKQKNPTLPKVDVFLAPFIKLFKEVNIGNMGKAQPKK
jgi:hypothetical protein